LASGDTVEIITSSHQSPNRSWLDSVQTVKARQSIRRWLKDEQHAHSVRLGQELLERELKRYPDLGVKYDLATVAGEFGLADTEHLYAALGSGDLSVGKLIGRLIPQQPKVTRKRRQDRRGIRIQGMDDLMISFGKCCTPIPGDAIIGLITRGRGVTVHRTDCPNIGQISEDPERLLRVNWDMETDQAFTVQLRVRSHDRKFLLSDISKALGDSGCNIQSATTRTVGQIAEQDFWVDVVNIVQLQQAMKKANDIDGVLEVLRIDESDAQSLDALTA